MSEVILLDTHIWIWLVDGSFERFPESWLSKFERANCLGVSPISCYEIKAANLSPIHKDPFDRLIIATALDRGAKLASIDSIFPQYSELENCLLTS